MSNTINEYTIDIDSYQASVVVTYSNTLSVQEISEAIEERESTGETSPGNEAGDAAMTFCIPEKRTIYLIFDKYSDLSHLAHECIHAASCLFYMIQTDHNQETEEVFAYLYTTIFKSVFNIIYNKCGVKKRTFLDLKSA